MFFDTHLIVFIVLVFFVFVSFLCCFVSVYFMFVLFKCASFKVVSENRVPIWVLVSDQLFLKKSISDQA